MAVRPRTSSGMNPKGLGPAGLGQVVHNPPEGSRVLTREFSDSRPLIRPAKSKPEPLQFAARWGNALGRRVGRAVTVKQFCAAISLDEDTLNNWRNKNGKPQADKIDAVIRFFVSLGDLAFVAEIFGMPPLYWLGEHRRLMRAARVRLSDARRGIDQAIEGIDRDAGTFGAPADPASSEADRLPRYSPPLKRGLA